MCWGLKIHSKRAMSLPANLTELGVSEPDMDWLVDSALEDPGIGGSLVAMDKEIQASMQSLYLIEILKQ